MPECRSKAHKAPWTNNMSIAPILGSSSLWPWPLKNKASGRFQRFERKVWSITVLTETMVPERYFGHDVSETRGISEATRVCKTTVRKLLLFWKLFDHFSETTLASEAVSRTLYLHIYIYRDTTMDSSIGRNKAICNTKDPKDVVNSKSWIWKQLLLRIGSYCKI